jgi:hypothetical protein
MELANRNDVPSVGGVRCGLVVESLLRLLERQVLRPTSRGGRPSNKLVKMMAEDNVDQAVLNEEELLRKGLELNGRLKASLPP